MTYFKYIISSSLGVAERTGISESTHLQQQTNANNKKAKINLKKIQKIDRTCILVDVLS